MMAHIQNNCQKQTPWTSEFGGQNYMDPGEEKDPGPQDGTGHVLRERDQPWWQQQGIVQFSRMEG